MNLMNKPMLATAQQLNQSFSFDFQPTLKHTSLGNLAMIPIEGLLLHRFNGYGTSYETIRCQIQSALDDTQVDHIVLDIDSGGGEVSGLFDLVDFIVESRNQKPITALVNEHAYSAAYLIASSANQIIAPKTGGVGSVGVIVAHLDQSEAEKKVGLEFTEIYAGDHKVNFSPHQPLTDKAKTEIQNQVNHIYELLLQTLARNRQSNQTIFQETEARTFSAEQALDMQLIDKIQSPYKFLEEHMMSEETIEVGIEMPEPSQVLSAERDRVKTIMQLCKQAKMPECGEGLIEEGASVEEARTVLFDKMAASTADIRNALPEKQDESQSLIQAMVQGLGGMQNARI